MCVCKIYMYVVCIYRIAWTCDKLITLLFILKTYMMSQLWWCSPLITALGRRGKGDSGSAWSTYWVIVQPQLYSDCWLLESPFSKCVCFKLATAAAAGNVLQITFLGLLSDLPNLKLWQKCLSLCFITPPVDPNSCHIESKPLVNPVFYGLWIEFPL